MDAIKEEEICRKANLFLFLSARCNGVPLRGLKNLGTPCKGDVFTFFLRRAKRTKSTPEVCEPLDSGDDSKLCRKRFCKAFRRLVPKPVLSAKRRRKGFESVRKGYRSADARLMFFEKGLLYCKLTVGFCG